MTEKRRTSGPIKKRKRKVGSPSGPNPSLIFLNIMNKTEGSQSGPNPFILIAFKKFKGSRSPKAGILLN